ncbi:MAG: hypothetical protein H0W50_00980 [Parachlamydiaceae bacterium]|nr:hypothetical protein [Parachlamydiaceae bacterium]
MNSIFSGAEAGAAAAMAGFVNSDAVEKVAAAVAQKGEVIADAKKFAEIVDPDEAGKIKMAQDKSKSEMPKNFKSKEVDKTKPVIDKIVKKEDELDKEAKAFSQGKPEFDSESLKKLHDKIKNDDTPESIIAKVKEHFPEGTPASQIFDALAFLLISIKDPKINEIVKNAKNQYGEENFEQIDISRAMTKLASKIDGKDTPESIIDKVITSFSKGAPASQIFDSLAFLQLSVKDPKTKEIVENAKNQFGEKNTKQIDHGRKMSELAHSAATAGLGLGTAKKLHGVFVDMVANENKTPDLFKQLCVQYPVYKDLIKMIKFVQSESGKDLHNGQIDNIYLGALNNTTKNLQSLVMVYRGFEKKIPQMDRQMENAIQHFEQLRSAPAAPNHVT